MLNTRIDKKTKLEKAKATTKNFKTQRLIEGCFRNFLILVNTINSMIS